MKARCPDERGKSAQSFPVSDRQQAASRTMVPPILLTQNRHPHRRWRGRFAVLDPARSLPGAASCLSGSGGQNDTSAAYRRASGRTRMERGSCRNSADHGRTGGRPGGTGSTRWLRRDWKRPAMPLHLFLLLEGGAGSGERSVIGGMGLRQDKRNGARPSGHHAITPCLHNVFFAFRHGATFSLMAPCRLQYIEMSRYYMAPWLHRRLPFHWVRSHG
jgi:hypothetical protein